MKNMLVAVKRLLACAVLIGISGSVFAEAAKGDAPPPNSIEDLQVTQQGDATILKLTLREPLAAAPASFSIANPARVAFDFPATGNGLGRSAQQVGDGDLRSVNIVEVSDRTRLVVNLRRNLPFETRIEGKALLITFLQSGTEAKGSPAPTHFAEAKPESAAQSIRDINFRRGKDGEGLVVIDLSDPNIGIDIRQQGTNLLVDFAKTSLPEDMRKRLDVTDFATPVTTVSTMTQGNNVRMVITPRGLWEHNAYQSDNQLVIEVRQVIEDPNKLVQGSRGGYQGEKLSLNFQNVEVRSVLQVISDFTNLNIVVSDSVSGSLTLRLKDVPWDQALDIILNTRGLDMRKNGNVLWIAPRDELAAKEKLNLESKQQISDLEPTRTESFQLNYHKAKTVQDFLKGKDQSLLSKRGTVAIDERSNKLFINDTPSRLEDIHRLIKEIDIPARQVLIEARIVEANDTFSKELGVKLGGWDPNGAGAGNKLLGNNGLRFGMGSTNADWQAGHNSYVTTQLANATATAAANSANAAAALADARAAAAAAAAGTPYISGFPVVSPVLTTPTIPFAQFINLPASNPNAGKFSLSLFNSNATQVLNLEVSALEADAKGKTITSPRVLTADKVEALIEQGVQVPYLQASSAGNTSVSFQKAVMALKVTPNITPDGRIIMTLDINKDEPDYAHAVGGSVPINTKHIKTDVLVENGGTVVIGGIFEQTESKQVNKVPLLGDIPVVGFMFRNNLRSDQKRELLVFITPKIIADNLTLR
jgi:type IV pilus assembly protein PilQ